VQLRRLIGVVRNQVEGLLKQGGIKLTAVATDAFGVSGWAMLQLITEGQTNMTVLAGEARGILRQKEAQLKEALAMKDHTATLVRLSKIPGVDLAAAQELSAEIGPSAATFATAKQFASWVGVCPGSQESAGVCYSHRSAKGNRYLRRLLCQIPWAATHTRDTFFAGLFARLKPKIEAKGAAWAVAHRIAKVVWVLLHDGVEYQERGVAPINPRTLVRKFRRLTRELAHGGLDAKSLLTKRLQPTRRRIFEGEVQRALRGRGCAMALLLAITMASYAQRSGAGLQVRVTDESGAIIPTAAVTVTGANGFARQLSTDGSGAYAVKGLAQGTYIVRVAQPGFETFESPAIELTEARLQCNECAVKSALVFVFCAASVADSISRQRLSSSSKERPVRAERRENGNDG
jgi:hypothetical protein